MKGNVFISGLISGLFTLGIILPALSQVTCDETINTTVRPNGNNFNILNGIQKGNNLFHSFKEFSIPQGSSAIFNNSTDVVNIINRVTGGNISNIDGLIQANGNANLFLINPGGIVFGENARLNIGGSFFATTADRIIFPDNIEFSATNTDEPPLLSINVPIGIQFGSSAATITNRSQTIDSDPNRPVVEGEDPTILPVGLQVKPSKSITLLGGSIEFDNGFLTASGGRINLGAVAPDSFVSLASGDFGWVLGYNRVNNFGDITLTGQRTFSGVAPSVDTTGKRGGDIDIWGKNILLDGFVVNATNLGFQNGGKITINSSESLRLGIPGKTFGVVVSFNYGGGKGVEIEITSPNIYLDSRSLVTTDTFSSGSAGNVTITAEQLFLDGFSTIGASTLGSGDGGNIIITAKQLSVDDRSSIGSFVIGRETGNGGDITITAEEFSLRNLGNVNTQSLNGSADSGNVTITAGSLSLDETASVSSGTLFGTSNGGNLTITAEQLSLDNSSSIFSGTDTIINAPFDFEGTTTTYGKGGNVTITANKLSLTNNSDINSSTAGSGNAGNILIRADNIDVGNSVKIDNPKTSITSRVEETASADGGDVDIVTKNLRVFNGGSIDASTLGQGNAGNISINAGTIDVNGVFSEQLPTQISAFSETDFAAGSVNLTADSINIRNGAEISVSNQALGDAGNLNLTAGNVFLDNGGSLKAEVNGGERGNINLNLGELLLLRRNGSIRANATGASQGGNITINSPIIAGFENSDIIADAVDGDGGNINIKTQGLFGLQRRNQLTNQSDISASSQFGIDGTIEIDNFGNQLDSGLVELPSLINTDVVIANSCVARRNQQDSTFYITGKAGFPYRPGEAVPSDYSMLEVRALPDGTSLKTSASRIKKGDSIVEATGIYRLENGDLVFGRECEK